MSQHPTPSAPVPCAPPATRALADMTEEEAMEVARVVREANEYCRFVVLDKPGPGVSSWIIEVLTMGNSEWQRSTVLIDFRPINLMEAGADGKWRQCRAITVLRACRYLRGRCITLDLD